MIRVAIADDQQLIRAGFRSLLESEPDIEIVGEAGTGAEAVALASSSRPDVLLIGIDVSGRLVKLCSISFPRIERSGKQREEALLNKYLSQ